ncbi:MAG: glucose 1-dehydrogenase [Candidatus Methanomethylicaceae archaeon]
MELEGRKALITGGGMGIGQAIALAMARAGADIAILDVKRDAAEETAFMVEKEGRRALVCEGSVSDAAVVDRAVERVMKEFGRIDILINNAGVTHPAVSILELDLRFLDEVTDVDWKGVYICSRRVAQEMANNRSGAIVNIASIVAFLPVPLAVYAPVKSAVVMFTKILARDLARFDIRVNAIAPGYVLTPLLEGMFKSGLRDPDRILNCVPMRKWVKPSDVAEAAVFLCSDKAGCITGVTLPVDAGFGVEGGWRAYTSD